jgi:hypothetical protein
VVVSAVVLALTACNQAKESTTVRKGGNTATQTAPGSTAAVNPTDGAATITLNTNNTARKVELTLQVPKFIDYSEADQQYQFLIENNGVFTDKSTNRTANLNFLAYHQGNDNYSAALPALAGSWNGGFASQCSNATCDVYYMTIYLSDGQNYQMIGLRYSKGAVVSAIRVYDPNVFLPMNTVISDLEMLINTQMLPGT